MERLLRDANHIYSPAGTSDIQRLRPAEVALGTHQDQWSARLADKLRASSVTLVAGEPANLPIGAPA
ncbi:hypothetical protein ACIQMJ_18630 [Actinosynnema sp. NPDC091369]